MITLGVLLLMFALVMCSSLMFFLGMVPSEILEAHVSAREAAVRYMCMGQTFHILGQYFIVAAIIFHAWASLKMWYAAAVTGALVLIWVATAPADKMMLTSLHPIGILHAPKSLLWSMDIAINGSVVRTAQAHRDTLLAMRGSAASAGAAGKAS